MIILRLLPSTVPSRLLPFTLPLQAIAQPGDFVVFKLVSGWSLAAALHHLLVHSTPRCCQSGAASMRARGGGGYGGQLTHYQKKDVTRGTGLFSVDRNQTVLL